MSSLQTRRNGHPVDQPEEQPQALAPDEATTVAGDGASTLPALGHAPLPGAAEEVVQQEGGPATHPGAPGRSIIAWLFRADSVPHQVTLDALPEIVARDENFAWVDLSEYSEANLRTVAATLGLLPAGVRASLAPWQRPRIDVFTDQFFVATTVAHPDPQTFRVRAGQLDLFVGRNFLVSAHKLPLPFSERVLARARQSPDLVQLDSVFMLYILLDELIAYYERLSEHVEDEIEQMEERALHDTSDDFLADLLHFKRYIFAVSRLAGQHRTVFAAFLRPDFTFGSEEVKPYYRELEERFGRLLDILLPAKEAVNGAFDIYVSHVSHRTNQVMKVLTMVSTVLLPATIILGFFGTSFEGIPLYQPGGFVSMLVLLVLTTTTLLWAFRRRGWF
jgi:magnesium transporter